MATSRAARLAATLDAHALLTRAIGPAVSLPLVSPSAPSLIESNLQGLIDTIASLSPDHHQRAFTGST
jgi:hypothetical protein